MPKRKRTIGSVSRRLNLIYGLIDPSDRLIHYVGLSSRGLERPREHRHAAKSDGVDCVKWIRELQSKGLDYEITVLEALENDSSLSAAERWWIAYGRACGWPLTNCTDGGEYSRRFRKPGFGVSDEDLQQARLVNFCNHAYKNGRGEMALAMAQRCLSAELFEWFKATVMEHYLNFSNGLPPRLVCPCGQEELLFDNVSLTEAVERMNAHLRAMSQLRNAEVSLKRQWMLHLS